MKKHGFIAIEVEIEGKVLTFQVEFEKFLEMYNKAIALKQDGIIVQVVDGEKTHTRKLPLSEAERIINQVGTVALSIIPKKLEPFLKDMNQKMVKTGRAKLPGRDSEVEKAFFYLSQVKRANVFLIGETEVGKTSIALEVIRKIAALECPNILKGKRVLRLNVSTLYSIIPKIEGLNSKDIVFEKTIDEITNFLMENRKNIVLFIDKALMMYSNYELVRLLQVIISANIPLIATCDTYYFEYIFLENPFYAKYYNYVIVEEPEKKEVITMAAEYAKRLRKAYSINISKEMIKFAAYTAGLSNSVSVDPGQTIDVLEKAFANAYSCGYPEVMKDNIINCYHLNDKLRKSVPEIKRKATAYHEAGHYIIHTKCRHASSHLNVTFVSILPANDWAGVNWLDYNYANTDITSKDFFIDEIACDLGGRTAERMITSTNTAGAYSDLEHANIRAREGVMRLGLAEIEGKENRAYDYEDYDLIPDETKQLIEEERSKWVAKGTRRAEEIIAENKELLIIIAEKLLKEEILTGEELEKICKDFEEKTKSK